MPGTYGTVAVLLRDGRGEKGLHVAPSEPSVLVRFTWAARLRAARARRPGLLTMASLRPPLAPSAPSVEARPASPPRPAAPTG